MNIKISILIKSLAIGLIVSCLSALFVFLSQNFSLLSFLGTISAFLMAIPLILLIKKSLFVIYVAAFLYFSVASYVIFSSNQYFRFTFLCLFLLAHFVAYLFIGSQFK